MRMQFELEDVESYEAGKELLLRRCAPWARDQDIAFDEFVASAALDFRHQSPDGRLGFWTTASVEEFLLDWMPRKITAPAADLAAAPETLRSLLRYLRHVELDDPTGDPLPELEAAIGAACGRFQEAMSDERRFGLAKFWAMKAMAAGVDVTDEAGMQRFIVDVQNDQVQYGEDILSEIARRHREHQSWPERSVPVLPVVLPPESVLTESAERSTVVAQLRTLVDWVGDGRPLTATGQLKLADARELVPLLATHDVIDPGIGDRTFHTKSSAELRELCTLVELAKKTRLIRTVRNRLVPVAKSKPLLTDGLALWLTAFETLPDLADTLFSPGMFATLLDELLPDMLNAVYSLPMPIPVVRLQEPAWISCKESFIVDEGVGEEFWRHRVHNDVQRALDTLAHLGGVKLSTGVPDPVYSLDLDSTSELPADSLQQIQAALTPGSADVAMVTLTPLGTYAVRRRLLAQGRHAPVVGELSSATAAQLLGTIAEHYDPDTGREELERWLQEHRTGAGLDELLNAVRQSQFRGRAIAMLDVLVAAQPDGNDLLRRLRSDPSLGPAAIHLLVEREQLSMDDLTPSEGLMGIAEQFLLLLETGGPDAFQAILAETSDVPELAYAVANSGHPDTTGLAELCTLAFGPLLKGREPHLVASHRPPRKRPKNKRRRKH